MDIDKVYDPPLKTSASDRSKMRCYKLPIEIYEEMNQYKTVNWSEVARQAFVDALEKIKAMPKDKRPK